MNYLTLEGKPVSVNAMYRGGRRFLTQEGKATKERYSYQARSQYKGKILEKELKITVKFYFSDRRKHDIDNCLKALFDSMTGVLWKDDNQITQLEVYKLMDKQPRVEMSFEEI